MHRRTLLKGLAGIPFAMSSPGLLAETLTGKGSTKAWDISVLDQPVQLSKDVTVNAKAYSTSQTGPLRAAVGDQVAITLNNASDKATSLHWHSLPRASKANLLDGDIVPAGKSRLAEMQFTQPGTHWLHPEMFHGYQIGQGLAVPVIVDEAKPYDVDFDEVALVQDWRVTPEGEIESFEDKSADNRSGRLGQYVTVNRKPTLSKTLPAGKRVRLRVINACVARTLVITNSKPDRQNLWVIARDGRPVNGIARSISKGVALGAGQTADLVFDMPDDGEVFSLSETRYQESAFISFRSEQQESFVVRREYPPLPPKVGDLGLPDLDSTVEQTVKLELSGGMKGNVAPEFAQDGLHWMVNGKPGSFERVLDSIKAGAVSQVVVENKTSLEHSIHFSGITGLISGLSEHVGHSMLVMPGMSASILFIPRKTGRISMFSHNYNHYRSGVQGIIEVR